MWRFILPQILGDINVPPFYSQERRRDRYQLIFIWKISQGLVSGYDIPFTNRRSITGSWAVPAILYGTDGTGITAVLKNAKDQKSENVHFTSYCAKKLKTW